MTTASKPSSLSTSARFLRAEQIAVRPLGHLRAEHRVVLGQRVVALDLEVGLAEPRATPWKKIASSTADTSAWPMPPSMRVVGPDRQVVLAALGQPARVVGEVALGVVGVDAEARRPRPG